MAEFESNKSFFNAGMAMAERIDSLQRALNAARFNPLAINEELSKPNFEIMKSACDGLVNECWGKMTVDERKEATSLKKVSDDFLIYKKILIQKGNDVKINNDNYRSFMILLDMYEKKCKVYLEAHDLNSPNKPTDSDDEL